MNFSSLLYVNVFVLGSTYLQLVKSLGIQNIPLIDPTLFIQRFVSKLDFPTENDGRKVMKDAIRLVQRMNKDWITEGRRPAGVAAASVLLACRMNNFRKSKLQIMQLAMISENTINERLKEFKTTNAATLTIRDFRATNVDSSSDPPAFTKNREAERLEEIQRPLREKMNPLDSPDIRSIYDFVMETVEKEGLEKPDDDFFTDIARLDNAGADDEAAAKKNEDLIDEITGEKEVTDEIPKEGEEELSEKDVETEKSDETQKEVEKDAETEKESEKESEKEVEKEAEKEAEKETEVEVVSEITNPEKDGEDVSKESDTKSTELVSDSAKTADSLAMPPPRTKRLATLNNPIEDRQARIQAILKRHNHPIINVTSQKFWDSSTCGISDDPENLSDVDDEEINGVILPPTVVKERELVWLTLNKDYVLEQAHKRNKKEADIQAGTYKEPRKRRKVAAKSGDGQGSGQAKTAAAAVAGMAKKKMFSRKINYNAVSHLFDQ